MKLSTEDLTFIRDNMSEADLYELVAEEAVELAKECLKYARIKRATNPTPAKAEETMQNILEEFSDVMLCTQVADIFEVSSIIEYKKNRWISRLKEAANACN